MSSLLTSFSERGTLFSFFFNVVVNTVVCSNIASSGRRADVLLGREGHLSLNFVYNGQGRVVIKAGWFLVSFHSCFKFATVNAPPCSPYSWPTAPTIPAAQLGPSLIIYRRLLIIS